MKKKCKDCGVAKEQSSFYGIQGECKDCTRIRVAANYRRNRDYYQAYEVRRNTHPSRKAARLKYQQAQRRANPTKYLARGKVLRAVKAGSLKKEPCAVCGAITVEAHHTDYSKPLLVVWLCKKHHVEADKSLQA